MLAQNFKSPADLNLTAEEFDAHVKVLGMLERGELVHCRNATSPKGFNMAWDFFNNDSGTVACIGGWVALLLKRDPEDWLYSDLHPCLDDLYFPPNRGLWGNITTDQAAIVLRNYLTCGEPRWHEVLAERKGE